MAPSFGRHSESGSLLSVSLAAGPGTKTAVALETTSTPAALTHTSDSTRCPLLQGTDTVFATAVLSDGKQHASPQKKGGHSPQLYQTMTVYGIKQIGHSYFE